MKIGVILPVGNLNKYGYQYNNEFVIKNLASFADELIIVSSTRENPKKLGTEYPNATYLNNEKTWFKLKGEMEVFAYDTLVTNLNLALAELKAKGCDIVMQVHVNQYLQEESWPHIRSAAERLLASGNPFGWEYKRYQLADWLFDADVRVPWMLNMTVEHPYEYESDAIIDRTSGKMVRIESGNFQANNAEAVTDIMLQCTLNDARELFFFTQAENIKLAGRTPEETITFDEKTWRTYMLHKLNAKTRSKESLGTTAVELAGRAKPEFLCFEFQKAYAPIRKDPLSRIGRVIANKIKR